MMNFYSIDGLLVVIFCAACLAAGLLFSRGAWRVFNGDK